MELASSDNSHIKLLKKLRTKKHRDAQEQFFVENTVLILDAALAGFCPLELFVTEAFIKKNQTKYNRILKHCKPARLFIITDRINRSFTELETAPGIAALYNKPGNEISFDTPVVYLNGINDPGNLGTILRSALAFGIKDVVIDENCADVFNSKTIHAAKESIFKINLEFDQDRKILTKIRKHMPILSTRVDNGENLGKMLEYDCFCMVLGSESHGVDKAIQKRSDAFIKIEMSPEMESLNVSAAAAIIFHEIFLAGR